MTRPRPHRREVRALVARIEAAGGVVRWSRGTNHFKVYVEGKLVTTLASTPSCWRAHRNAESDLRRAGLDL